MSEWQGEHEDWRIDWVTYGGPYIRYPAWPHPENNHEIARLSFPDTTPFEVKRARASLIAAAPDMYEALVAIIDANPDFWRERFALALAAARAALAKARGAP